MFIILGMTKKYENITSKTIFIIIFIRKQQKAFLFL